MLKDIETEIIIESMFEAKKLPNRYSDKTLSKVFKEDLVINSMFNVNGVSDRKKSQKNFLTN